ncbi:MAG: phosphoribosylamine--glycine ligase [Candidatus Pacebacteria bacterium]|nr:phosphoribosylamine--glycine ligase [Candidatus Paceibacterota bacterium]
MSKRNVLLIGGGGREHALAWKLSQSQLLEKLYIAPGNGGTGSLAENVPIPASDIKGLVQFARTHKIDFVFVGPDDPLALGIVDAFEAVNIPIFGPSKLASQLESSKAFAKDFMMRHSIPTSRYAVFSDFESAVSYADRQTYPIVIKASGLALGKGVIIVKTKDEALETLRRIFVEKVFGDSGNEVVIEEFMEGVEFSVHAFSDGQTIRIFPASQDHKRAHEGDEGPNTGGMGVVAPVPFVSNELLSRIDREIITPTIKGMAEEKIPFVGILYPGIMVTREGPKVIEYNVRFGDPEAQAYMRLLETDLLAIAIACVEGRLKEIDIKWKHMFACNIVIAANGYPSAYEKGEHIGNIEEAERISGVVVFHAGTKIDTSGALVSSGGRVLGVSCLSTSLPEALKLAYEAVTKILYSGKRYRSDIGKKALITPKI